MTVALNSNTKESASENAHGIRSSIADTESLKGAGKYTHLKTFTCCFKSFIPHGMSASTVTPGAERGTSKAEGRRSGLR